jgi:hypothetical protein
MTTHARRLPGRGRMITESRAETQTGLVLAVSSASPSAAAVALLHGWLELRPQLASSTNESRREFPKPVERVTQDLHKGLS